MSGKETGDRGLGRKKRGGECFRSRPETSTAHIQLRAIRKKGKK